MSVVVHCSDGWDRTSQVRPKAMLVSDLARCSNFGIAFFPYTHVSLFHSFVCCVLGGNDNVCFFVFLAYRPRYASS